MAGKRKVSAREAMQRYGITTSYELMPNGEFRSRMTPSDGNGYIRTLGSPYGGWQNAHYHKSMRETYVVEKGWIASAERTGSDLEIKIHVIGDIFTTEPNISHNIYMSAESIIHTVKHGGRTADDWHADDELSFETKALSESEIIRRRAPRSIDDHFSSYVDTYNSLDKLVWSVPGFLGVGGTVVIGFLGSILSRNPMPNVTPAVFSGVLLFSSLLFFLAYVSMTRLREHHTAVGEQLARMEKTGYFAFRLSTVARRWPISAPLYFRVVYAALSVVLFVMAISVIIFPRVLDQIIS